MSNLIKGFASTVSVFALVLTLVFSQAGVAEAAEFVNDGDFSNATLSANWSVSGPSVQNVASALRFNGFSASSASQSLSGLAIGSTYNISFDITGVTNTGTLAGFDISSGGSSLYNSGEKTSTGTYNTGSFVATANTATLFIQGTGGVGGGTITIDNVSVDGVVFTNTDPVVTGGATAAVSVAEGTTTVTTVVATDADTVAPVSQTISYSITGGVDEGKFSVDSGTGALTFNTAPDFEIPTQAGATANEYVVAVTASDDYSTPGTDVQTVTVTVTDVPLTMTSAQTIDSNSDGHIDAISVTFSSDLDGPTVNGSGSDFNVVGYTVTSASEGAPGDVDIILTPSGIADTGATPTVSIAAAQSISSTPTTGSETITSGSILAIDAAKPVLAEVTPVPTPSNNTSPSYTFSSSEAGTYTVGGSCTSASPLSVVSGDNTITLTAPNGDYNDCTIIVTDTAGNASLALDVTDFTVDTVAPDVALSYSVDPAKAGSMTVTATYTESVAAAPTINIAQQGTTDITAAAMTGAVPGSVFTYDYTVVTDDGLTYKDGVATVSLSAVADAAGNNANAPTNTTFVIDTQAPLASTDAPDLKTSSDTGDSSSDNNTASPLNTLTFSVATCPIGQSIQMYAGGGSAVGSVVACTGAIVDVTVPVASTLNGSYNFRYTLTDTAGNESATSPSLPVIVDNAAPADPVFTTITDDTGISATDWITNDTTIIYNGTAPADATQVRVWRGATDLGFVPVAATAWTIDDTASALVDGAYVITAKSYDLAGNESSLATKNITIDTTVNAPAITSPTPGQVVSVTPAIVGTSDAGALIEVKEGATSLCTTTADGAGAWTCNVTFAADGAHTIAAEAADVAGNGPTVGASINVTVDNTAPILAEIIPIPTYTNNNTPDYTFDTDESGAIAYSGGCTSGTAVALFGASTILTLNTLIDGTYLSCAVTVTDGVGNISSPLGFGTFTIDTVQPHATIDLTSGQNDITNNSTINFDITFDASIDAATVTAGDITVVNGTVVSITSGDAQHFNVEVTASSEGTVSIALPTGTVDDLAGNSNDTTTNTNNDVIYDTTAPVAAEVTAVAAISSNNTPDYVFNYADTHLGTPAWGGKCNGYFPAGANTVGAGNNTKTASAMPDDSYDDCTLTITDQAGNASNVVSITTFVIDTTAPTLAEVTAVPVNTNNNTPDYVFSYTDATLGTPDFTGKCNGRFNEDTDTVTTGNNTKTATTMPDDNYNNCTLVVTDQAGNVSTPLVMSAFTVDTVLPTAPVVTGPVVATAVSALPTFVGTADAGTAVTVLEGASTVCTAAVSTAGAWSCVTASALSEGDHNITATAEDLAGNTSLASAPATVVTVSGFTTSPTSMTINENGGTGTFTIVLDAQPTTDVVIEVSSSATAEATVSPATLTFTNANWNSPQTVTVTGIDDSSYTTDTASITVAVNDAASDNGFDSFADENVAVTLTNNDSGGGGGIFTGSFGSGTPAPSAVGPAPAPTGQVLGVDTFRFNNNMSVAINSSLSPDVTELQERLTAEGVYSGPITGFFGPLTRAGVIAYQEAHNITPAAGFVGPITREVLNASEVGLTEDERTKIQEQINQLLALIKELTKQLGEL